MTCSTHCDRCSIRARLRDARFRLREVVRFAAAEMKRADSAILPALLAAYPDRMR